MGHDSSEHLSPSNQDDLKSCCEEDRRDGAAHCKPFLQLVAASCACLGRVEVEESSKYCYEALDAWGYVEKVEEEVDELLISS